MPRARAGFGAKQVWKGQRACSPIRGPQRRTGRGLVAVASSARDLFGRRTLGNVDQRQVQEGGADGSWARVGVGREGARSPGSHRATAMRANPRQMATEPAGTNSRRHAVS